MKTSYLSIYLFMSKINSSKLLTLINELNYNYFDNFKYDNIILKVLIKIIIIDQTV